MVELQKVFGFKANKCKTEVVSREELAVVLGDETDYDNEDEGFFLNYPTGYNRENTIIVGASVLKERLENPHEYLNQSISSVELKSDWIWVYPGSGYTDDQSTMVSVMVAKGINR